MSGNIFASSTVPGIKDRDRDKQVIALWGQSYYLSRTDFTNTYWVKLIVGSTLLMIVVPIFFARLFYSTILQPQPDPTAFLARFFPPALRPNDDVQTSTFRLAEIPISAVLSQALATSNSTRSRGLLTHALLELQNPEITTFAGPGFGVHLKEMNRGSQLEAFPDGKLPWCGVRGRYDEWPRMKGLRYAYRWITTVEETSLMEAPDGASDVDRFDLESLLMGWPALLLERARVDDPLNPVPPGSRRNVYGEAVDRIVKEMCSDSRCDWGHHIYGQDQINNNYKDITATIADAQKAMMTKDDKVKDKDLLDALLMKDAGFAFILPPFFAMYAVAREDTKWLVGAVRQLDACLHGSIEESDQEIEDLWTSDTEEPTPAAAVLGFRGRSEARLSNNPWAWAGVTRVLSVLEKWKPNVNAKIYDDRVRYENWKTAAILDLKEAMNTFLLEMREESSDTTEVHSFCLDSNHSGSCKTSGRNPALTGLLVGSIYRLARLHVLDDLDVLGWADQLYNAVARHVRPDGNMGMATEKQEDSTQLVGLGAGEDQSIVIMMWTARRDCTKVGICRKYGRPSRWQRLKSFVVSFLA